MDRFWLRTAQAYVIVALLVAGVVPASPYSLLSLALLLVVLFITVRAVPPGLSLAVTTATLFLMPLVITPLVGYLIPLPPVVLQIAAAASALPVIYLLDFRLRGYAKSAPPSAREAEGRRIGNAPVALSAAVLAVLALSSLLSNLALMFVALALAFYLLGVMAQVLRAVPVRPFACPPLWRRVIAGGTIDVSQYIVSRASVRLEGTVRPVDSWVRVKPEGFAVKDRARLDLTFTPPLAGPARPRLRVVASDPRGFVQVDQLVEPVELHVIPRARYAEWLAKRYLEQTQSGVFGPAMLPHRSIVMPKRGVEYHSSRAYQPGDHLRDIDWRHTTKYNQLIVKEYTESGSQAAIIAVNLSVGGMEAADKLASSLITAVLTFAEEGIPTALAAYNERRVVLTVPITDPREVLRQVLSLVKEIETAEFSSRCLELPDIARLRRNIALVGKAQSEPAKRLLEMLTFEYRAIEGGAQDHPATLALSAVTRQIPAPAMILIVSEMNHDAEAVQVAVPRLSRREFSVVSAGADIFEKQKMDS